MCKWLIVLLNGYKSKPFNNCKRNDYVYKFIINKDYISFWNSKYHHQNDSIQFLKNGYNQFNNNKLIQDLLQQMFAFYPMKRIEAKDIEHHAWLIDMHGHKNLLGPHRYKGEFLLQRLLHMYRY